MVTVFLLDENFNFAEDLSAICLHRDVNYDTLIVLLTYLCLGCDKKCIVIFRPIFF